MRAALADPLDHLADDPPDDPAGDDQAHPALAAILAGSSAWSSEAELVAAAGVTPEALADLAAVELVALWVLPDESPVWTLTPLGAARLQVEIVEFGPGEEPAWRRIGRPPPAIRMPRRNREVSYLDGEQFAAPREGPFEELMKDIDEEPVRLFTRLPDGSETSGITIRIDPRLRKGPASSKVRGSKAKAKTTGSGSGKAAKSKAAKTKAKQAKALG